MDRLHRTGWLAGLVLLAGCANVNTLARSSRTPLDDGRGKAIHLDAQQRLVIFTAQRYCAEPSPDALAAYAAAIGVSASKLQRQSAALSGAVNSVVGSIGLRTQSITLMRDTLYRNCEAALNGYLSPEQASILMSRSQDLTAVILAIEQLTGAVAAPPVVLQSGGGSSAASSLQANTEALRSAEEILAKLKAERDETEKKKNELGSTLDLKKKEAEAARLSALSDPTKQDEANAKELARQAAQKDHEFAEQAFERARDSFLRQQETTAHIKALRDSSVNATNASVSGGGSTSSIVVQGPKQADTQYIAATVDEMIRRYLHKDYFADACVATLLRTSVADDIRKSVSDQASRNALEGVINKAYQADETGTTSDPRAQSLAQAERNQRALSYVCLRYFAQFTPHYGLGERQAAERTETTPTNPSNPTGNSPPADAANKEPVGIATYRDDTAKTIQAILNTPPAK